nr:amidohydrolase family protein [Dickeya lacustris]
MDALPHSIRTASRQAYRASVLHFTADPLNDPQATQFIDDGVLIVCDGYIEHALPYHQLDANDLASLEIIDYRGRLLMPGFIDTHVHFPQMEMIASYGEQLLSWLNTYTFPTERKFADARYARERADFFLQQLLRHGTTTALVFATVHPQSVDALFQAAQTLDMCLIAGKVMMDSHAPHDLCDTPAQSYAQSKALIEKWHRRGRLHYAVTPRFAATSIVRNWRWRGNCCKSTQMCICIHIWQKTRTKSPGCNRCFPNIATILMSITITA